MNEVLLLWRFFVRWWWLMLLPVIVVAVVTVPNLLRGGGASGGFETSFRYTAAQSNSNLPNRDGDFQDVWLASEYLVNALTEWVKSSSFRDELARELGDRTLLETLGIASDRTRSIGLVQMTHADADTLARISNAAVRVLSERNLAYFPHLGGDSAQVTLLDAPVISPNPPSLPNRFEPFIRLALGVLVGVLLAGLAEATDRTHRYPDELERQGLVVLARIPKE